MGGMGPDMSGSHNTGSDGSGADADAAAQTDETVVDAEFEEVGPEDNNAEKRTANSFSAQMSYIPGIHRHAGHL